ncbi:MAG: lipid-A-disaccharide synthase [Primorskyibacter sp.]
MGGLKVFVIAGEPSGDRLGAAMMAGLRDLTPDVQIQGVGGDLMAAAGLDSLFPMDEISIMGLGEILSQYRALKARIRQVSEAIIAARPDVVVTIDLPEFNLRVARLVKAAAPDVRIVHYVAPTVWAWRPGRAAKMAAHVDQVLALLPFEPPYMEAAGMRCDFVGHPVVSESQATQAEAQAFRLANTRGADRPLVLILPGSRRGEVARLTPLFGAAIKELAQMRPDLDYVVVAAGPVSQAVQAAVAEWPVKVHVVHPGVQGEDAYRQAKRAAFAAADVAIAASGTVSLELAAARTPMVIAYDMAWLSRQIIGRMLRVDTVTLVNLVADSRTVPEFIGTQCRPDLIAPAVAQVLADPSPQHQAMTLCMARLGAGGEPPGLRAARAVLDGLSQSRSQH